MTIDVISEHIVSTPDVLGGKPHVKGRRISVQDVAVWHERLGQSVDEIATDYQLTLGEVYAALAYYHDHRSAIDAELVHGVALVADLRAHFPSKLAERRRA